MCLRQRGARKRYVISDFLMNLMNIIKGIIIMRTREEGKLVKESSQKKKWWRKEQRKFGGDMHSTNF